MFRWRSSYTPTKQVKWKVWYVVMYICSKPSELRVINYRCKSVYFFAIKNAFV